MNIVLQNHHCILDSLSMDFVAEESGYDDKLLDRYRDPGAGGYTYHIGKFYSVSRDVAAGEEVCP